MADETTPRGEPTTATVTVIPTPAAGAAAVDPATALPAFTPADIDLSPLDPRQNGVLDALGRIEAAVAKARRLALVEGHDKAGTPIVRAGGTDAARDAAGRFTSTRALAQGAESGGTSGLQQKIRKVKRIEQRVERTLPGGDAPAPGGRWRRCQRQHGHGDGTPGTGGQTCDRAPGGCPGHRGGHGPGYQGAIHAPGRQRGRPR